MNGTDDLRTYAKKQHAIAIVNAQLFLPDDRPRAARELRRAAKARAVFANADRLEAAR